MPHDPQRIINTATSFFLAADRAFEQRSLGPDQVQMLLVPAIVCRAFAIELYLKAIITLEDGNASGHDLSSLYGRTSQSIQVSFQNRLALAAAELAQSLAPISKSFVEWRYIYESGSVQIDPTFLYNFAYAAKVEAENMQVVALASKGS